MIAHYFLDSFIDTKIPLLTFPPPQKRKKLINCTLDFSIQAK